MTQIRHARFFARATDGDATIGNIRPDRQSGWISWPDGAAPCVFGRSGLIAADAKREGDGATPIGDWRMRQAFFRPDRLVAPVTSIPLTALAPDMGWCDDPASPDYNRAVALPLAASHERLWREDHVYDLIVVLGYNDAPPVPGLGSAIFLHLAQPDARPTEGCVATGLYALLSLLATAGPDDDLAVAR